MVMRVGGLATGMDIEAMVNKLMEAERMPLDRMKQEQTKLIWKQDAFRDINRALLELDQMMLDMKLSPTYQSKIVSSSNESAVTATATTSATDGAYEIQVEQLATNAIKVGEPLEQGFDPTKTLRELNITDTDTEITITTYDEQGNEISPIIKLSPDDTLNGVLKQITDADNNVRAFYDAGSNRVIIETTRTGKYKGNGSEITFSDHEFFNRLNLDQVEEKGGTNAVFTYNNALPIESRTNSYTLNGINFDFKNVTEGNVRLTVDTDIDHTVDAIKKFVDKYNEVIDKLNGSQQEERYRDFPPLTDEQKKEMSEDEIKKWEEKAKSGILRGESAISAGMFDLRQSWYSSVATEGEYNVITQIGITTSNRYMDGGKLEVDEEQLRKALLENPDDVRKLLSNSADGDSRGLINRLEDAVEKTMDRIEETAGKSTHTLDNYTLGKRMKDLNERIAQFEARMVRVETRYWNQFTQMEKAIQRMNDQSAQLFSQFGGM